MTLNEWKCLRFHVDGGSRKSRFGTGESWKEDLANSVSVTKESWFSGKCVGRECTPEVANRCFEKRRKVIRLMGMKMSERSVNN